MIHLERGPDGPPSPDHKKADGPPPPDRKKADGPPPPDSKAREKKDRDPEPAGELPPPLN